MNKLAPLRHLMLKQHSLLYGGSCQRAFSQSRQVLAGGFAKDFKPGPYPATESERVAAAKKYNLRPEDYEPFPDDGFGFGDYPKMPPLSVDMKSDWEDWDDPYLRRNFGEPVNILAEQITGDRVSLKPTLMSFSKILFYFFLGSGLFIGTAYYLQDYKGFIPVAPKQFPRDVERYGEKHYKI